MVDNYYNEVTKGAYNYATGTGIFGVSDKLLGEGISLENLKALQNC